MKFLFIVVVLMAASLSISSNVYAMKPLEGFVTMRDGVQLLVKKYEVSSARGVILITHGILEHSGRYKHVAQYFNEQGYNVVTYDLRGHGLSGGSRAYVRSFIEYVNDLEFLAKNIAEEYSGLNLVLLGHSMGGLITYLYSTDMGSKGGYIKPDSLKAYVLSSPAVSRPPLKLTDDIQARFIKWTQIVKLFPVVGKQYRSANIRSEDLDTDQELLREHKVDPLIQKKYTINLSLELLKWSEKVEQNLKSTTVILPEKPTFLLQGTDDVIVDWKQNLKSCLKANAINEKIFKCAEIPGEKHEILNSVISTRIKIFDDIKDFIDFEARHP